MEFALALPLQGPAIGRPGAVEPIVGLAAQKRRYGDPSINVLPRQDGWSVSHEYTTERPHSSLDALRAEEFRNNPRVRRGNRSGRFGPANVASPSLPCAYLAGTALSAELNLQGFDIQHRVGE